MIEKWRNEINTILDRVEQNEPEFLTLRLVAIFHRKDRHVWKHLEKHYQICLSHLRATLSTPIDWQVYQLGGEASPDEADLLDAVSSAHIVLVLASVESLIALSGYRQIGQKLQAACSTRPCGPFRPAAPIPTPYTLGMTARPVMRADSVLSCHEWVPDNKRPLALIFEKEVMYTRITERVATIAKSIARGLVEKRTSEASLEHKKLS